MSGDEFEAQKRDWDRLFDVAEYIEKLKSAEQQWIMSRMAWLLSSQSFCILAYVSLAVARPRDAMLIVVEALYVLLPLLGLAIAALAACSIWGADRVNNLLINKRASVARQINLQVLESEFRVPVIGGKLSPDERAKAVEGWRSRAALAGRAGDEFENRDGHIFGTLQLGRAVLAIPVLLMLFWTYLIYVGVTIDVHAKIPIAATPADAKASAEVAVHP